MKNVPNNLVKNRRQFNKDFRPTNWISQDIQCILYMHCNVMNMHNIRGDIVYLMRFSNKIH